MSTALSPLQSARLQVLAENLNASMHITLPLFKGLIMQMFCEINEMKRLILNSHSWLELARLALFLFVLFGEKWYSSTRLQHPTLMSFFPRSPCYASFSLYYLAPLCFHVLGTTYSHECACIIPPDWLRQTCLTILGGWGWVLFLMDLSSHKRRTRSKMERNWNWLG